MNILYITADQWRAECLSVLGHPLIQTPNLDELAKQGVVFRNHFAQSTPCSPSRSSIHTGMYLHNHRVCINGTPLNNRHTNWAIEARAAGYDPFIVGYADVPVDPQTTPATSRELTHYSSPLRGANTDTHYYRDVPTNWLADLKAKGYEIPAVLQDLYANPANGKEYAKEYERGGAHPLPLAISFEDHETNFQTNRCIKLIGEQKAPWVCHLSLLRPHPPFIAPAPYNRMYNPADVDVWQRAQSAEIQAQQHPWLRVQLSRDDHLAPADHRHMQRLKASYYGLMTEVDDCLGKLFRALKASGQWHDTLIIFSSDHGEQMGDQWLMGKCGYYDASYHIPLIIRCPTAPSIGAAADATRGTFVPSFTENIDIMPTILDYLGVEIPEQCDGYSLRPLLENASAPPGWRSEVHWQVDFRDIVNPRHERELAITQHQCGISVIRDERYKYVHFTALPPLFFDLKNDPHEACNLAEDANYASLVLHYAQKMISWRMNHEERAYSQTYLCEPAPITRKSPLTDLHRTQA